MPRRRLTSLAIALASVMSVASVVTPRGLADAVADSAPGAPYELAFAPARDWTLLAAAVAVDLGLEYTLAQRTPPCRWCDYGTDADGNRVDTLNGFDRAGRGLRWRNTARAATLSDVSQAAIPLLAGGALVWLGQLQGATASQSWHDVVIMGQAVAVTRAVTQLVKVSARRHRPFVHAQGPDAVADSPDGTLSFFSGHASTSFSIAASAATIATLRGYKAAPWMWTGLAVAGTTGYLRLAADKHYATDVLTGAAVGTAIGVGLTYLLHGRTASRTGPRVTAVDVVPDAGDHHRATIIAISGSY
ncbi:MAG: phosphatase PAP2 family protein [Myxococcales bacterium]|nr:phosphatase PAP2 family protein [Myxococcales bacterium]